MAIYGTAVLSLCLLIGIFAGRLLGVAIGVEANVGGVGIAMLLLIVATDWLRRTERMPTPTASGVLFWSSIYIPVVVAMAASQNVKAAVSGGPAAIFAGTLVVFVSFAMVPMISRIGAEPDTVDEAKSASAGGPNPPADRPSSEVDES